MAEQAQPEILPGFEEGVVLADLLCALAPARREAFVLTQLLGMPYAQAASVARCPVGTVRSRVARARETLIALVNSAEGSTARRPDGTEREAAPAGFGATWRVSASTASA